MSDPRRHLALLLVACSLLACGGASSNLTSITTALPASTTIEEPLPASPLPRSACCNGAEIAAGRYELPAYWGEALSIAVGDGWRVTFDNPAQLVALLQGTNAVGIPSRWFYLIRAPAGLGVREVIDAMAAMPSITVEEGPVESEVASFAAFRLDALAKDDPNQLEAPSSGVEAGSIRLEALNDTGYFAPGFLIITATRQSQLRFLSVDTGERTMLVLIDAPPEEFADFAAQAEAVLESLSFA